MFGDDDWAPISGAAKYGMSAGPAHNSTTELSMVAAASEQSAAAAKPWSPESPMFAFGVLGLITFGLMAFSTSVRVGKTSASLNLGDVTK